MYKRQPLPCPAGRPVLIPPPHTHHAGTTHSSVGLHNSSTTGPPTTAQVHIPFSSHASHKFTSCLHHLNHTDRSAVSPAHIDTTTPHTHPTHTDRLAVLRAHIYTTTQHTHLNPVPHTAGTGLRSSNTQRLAPTVPLHTLPHPTSQNITAPLNTSIPTSTSVNNAAPFNVHQSRLINGDFC